MNSYQLGLMAQDTKGKFFSVVFQKKDGQLRKMTCRLGVHQHTKGGINHNPHLGDTQMIVWEPSKGYRTLNMLAIKKFKFKGEEYEAD